MRSIKPEGVFSVWDWLGLRQTRVTIDPLAFALAGPALAAVVADRQEMQAKCDELISLRVGDFERPYWERTTTSAYAAEFERLCTSPSLSQRFSPLLLMMKHTLGTGDWSELIDTSGMRAVTDRDTALVAIALELYHRREGKWPEILQLLVPGLLPRAPLDQYDGKPLRYRLIEGRPTVYSVGPDRQDDGGIFPADGTSGWKAPNGDWRLFPPAENPEG